WLHAPHALRDMLGRWLVVGVHIGRGMVRSKPAARPGRRRARQRGDDPMTPARLRWIEREDLTAAGWREDDDGRWRHPDHGVMWPAWDGWRGMGTDGREVGPCGTAMEVVDWLTREVVCSRP